MQRLIGQLTPDGAVVDALLEPNAAERQDLFRRGLPVPGPARLQMLVDTGAQRSSIDEMVVAGWGLTGGTFVWLQNSNGKQQPTRRMKFKFEIVDRSGQVILRRDPLELTIRKTGSFAGSQLTGLIGLDVLTLGWMQFNHPTGHFSLNF